MTQQIPWPDNWPQRCSRCSHLLSIAYYTTPTGVVYCCRTCHRDRYCSCANGTTTPTVIAGAR